ncbi:MAG TPA: hydrogenase expression/formation protein HypE [Gaiella sp.]|uniref:hydrogenase expression/formation protein HypE n=1 Tax=Gaiella sp. TaxID=2663207 RepID=UPI002D7E4826|nr:hydrogenase expression/formation protein HypE [Gaiella sp.]HET9288873.1 hydrogenase expression/formation protein HypE [Gaiella sp.]
MPEGGRRRRPVLRDELVNLSHGAGGKATRDLVEALFLEELGNEALAPLGDSAVVAPADGRLALTTDCYVVRPLVFPGGDIGELAVNGTLNDLAVAGARPLWLTAGFVLEEGLPIELLRSVVRSMAAAAERAGVPVAAGDTKVVERGKADGLYVTTAGVGVLDHDLQLVPGSVRPGDRVLLSGTLADHGMAVMIARGDLHLEGDVESDTAPLHELTAALLGLGEALRWMRDPTRGGLATALNELAAQASLAVRLEESALPVRPPVHAACEILGIDPLYVANEGKLVAVVAADSAVDALAILRAHPLGADAVEIGVIEPEPEGMVLLDTSLGGSRIVDLLVGDPLPRIC